MKPDREEVLRMADASGFVVADGMAQVDFWDCTEYLEKFYALAYEAGAGAERENGADWTYLSPEQRAILQRQLNERMRSMLDATPLPPPPTA